ncbi:MAG: hypothetical protein EAY81_09640 [Bacteroidetes bacterium]|nr:MAG: hypothetical protein EAY81_09640 [Bacteroidota bacterium]
MKKIIIGIAVATLLFTTSCLKESIDDITNVKGVTASPTWAIPLLNAEAGLKDFVGAINNDVDLGTTPDKVLLLTFKSADSLQQTNLFTIPSANDNVVVNMPAQSIPIFELLGKFENEITNEYIITAPNSSYVERVLVKNGSITADVQSTFKHDTKVYVSYPGITKNSIPLVDSFIFIYTGTTQTINRIIDLSGYEIDFTKNGSTNNTIEYNIKATIIRNPANPVSVTDGIVASKTIKINNYSRLEGYFGELDLLNIDETNQLSLFDKGIDGNVFINNPRLIIKVKNSVGMPITGKFSELYVISGLGARVPIILDQFADSFTVNYTTTIGQEATTEYIVDKSNSNIDEVLSSAPQSLKYVVNFVANKGNIPTPNVVYDYSRIKTDAFFEIPFDARIVSYSVESKAPFNLSGIDSDLDSANFKLEYAEVFNDIKSSIPLNALVQMYFLDSLTGTIYDSLYNTPFRVPAASVDAAGEVTASAESLSNSYIDSDKFYRIKKANQYRLRVVLRTAENNSNLPYVRFYESQRIKFKLGIKTKITYKS